LKAYAVATLPAPRHRLTNTVSARFACGDLGIHSDSPPGVLDGQ
jgi:hypothetical protein